jgi:fibronectin type 3 domain-containing protein
VARRGSTPAAAASRARSIREGPSSLLPSGGADTTSPPAPGAPSVAVVSESSLTLVWPPVTAPDLLRYRVWRGDAAGGPYEPTGTAVEPAFTDDTVSTGSTYYYVVTAEDTSF